MLDACHLGVHLSDFRCCVLPRDARHDEVASHPILVRDAKVEERIEERIAEKVRLEAEIQECCMFDVVIVFLELGSRVGHRLDLHIEAEFGAGLRDEFRELIDAPHLGNLVEDTHASLLRRIIDGELNAAHGVTDVEVAPRLSSFPVDGERVSDGGLHAEAVQCRAKDAIVVESVDEHGVHGCFVRGDTVHDTLVEVCARELPRLGREVDIMRVMHFGEVVEGAALFRVRQRVCASVVFDGDVSFFDIDIRRSIFSHGSQLDKMAVRREFLHGEEHVDGSRDIIFLREDGALSVHHAVRRRALFSKVHDCLRLEAHECVAEELVVTDVADGERDFAAGEFMPPPDAVVYGRDGRERLEAELRVEVAPTQVVDNVHFVATVREVERLRPAAVSISTNDHHTFTPS